MELEKLIYTFFKKFSRFEYALKQAGYVRVAKGNFAAQVDWKAFESNKEYEVDSVEQELLENAPQREIYSKGVVSWENLKFGKNSSDIKKLMLALKTVRNNLFHGDKYVHGGWADDAKSSYYLEKGIHCLDKLATFSSDIATNYKL